MTTIAPVLSRPEAGSRGRTKVTAKALSRVVSAVTADALGVDATRVGVELADERGNLALTVSTPIRVASIRHVADDPGVVPRSGGSVMERSARAEQEIGERVERLTGSSIARVTLQLTGVHITQEARVR